MHAGHSDVAYDADEDRYIGDSPQEHMSSGKQQYEKTTLNFQGFRPIKTN